MGDRADGRCHASRIIAWLLQECVRTTPKTNPFQICLSIRYNIVRTIYGFGPFMFKNRLSVTMPRVMSFLAQLRQAEAAKLPLGVAGFCWGGPHLVQLAKEMNGEGKALVDVCFTAHPSALSFPKDIEGIRKPFSVAVGDKDPLMTPAQALETEAILRNSAVEHEVVVYEGAGHGFSVRIDRTNPKQTEQAVLAEKQAVNWFTKHFEKFL
jgi:dienelactone hydrolase